MTLNAVRVSKKTETLGSVQTEQNGVDVYTSVVRYLDTYCRYLRDDTSIAMVTIYRGIS